MCSNPLQFVCVTKLVCLCVHIICVYSTYLSVCVCVCVCVCVSIMQLYTIDTTKNPVRYLFLEHTCAGFLYSLYV